MESLSAIRIIDLVDILLVTILVTTSIIWIKKMRAGRVAVGLFLLAALYIVARMAGLSLLSGLFEGSMALFVLMAVVIFQKELRRFFEGVAAWGLGRHPQKGTYDPTDLLVECISGLAHRRIGALVVLPGREPIEGHTAGGVELGGTLSRPLIYSLFDPSSPGHDGAVIVDGDRVTKFSVHLPLSTNFDLLGDLGTRHSAALGLSEQADALCLIVSEERGITTAAHNGRLYRVDAGSDLKKMIQDHLAGGKTDERERFESLRFFKHYWIETLVSAGLVLGIWWVVVAGSVQIEKTYNLPVQVVGLPSDLVLDGIEPEEVTVGFRGPRRVFQLSSASSFEVTIDTALAPLGRRTFYVRAQNIRYPDGLEFVKVQPETVRISVKTE